MNVFRKAFGIAILLLSVMAGTAAYSADYSWEQAFPGADPAQFSCTVSDITTWWGIWKAFTLDYNFCDGNTWRFRCKHEPDTPGIVGSDPNRYTCSHVGGPLMQACGGKVYKLESDRQWWSISLAPGTGGAQQQVCLAGRSKLMGGYRAVDCKVCTFGCAGICY